MTESGDVVQAARKKVADCLRPGIKPQELVAFYDDWSQNYEEMLDNGVYNAPTITVDAVLRQVPPERRAETRVLDVAAGTGLVGRYLHKEGFRHIDAVDPSEGMMKKLNECGVYTKKFIEPIGTGQSSVPSDTYDLVVISGGMSESHIPVSGLDDLVRVSKKGGLVIIAMRLEFREEVEAYKEKLGHQDRVVFMDKLESYMNDLEEQGAWRKVERRVVPNYFYEKEGIVLVYRVD